MKNKLRAIAVLFLSFSGMVGQTIYINSITAARQPGAGDGGYTLDGQMMSTSARLKLLEPANFGPGGTYSKSVEITDAFGVSGSLVQVCDVPRSNIFFFGNFNELSQGFVPFTADEVDSLYSWSITGGKLIVAAGQRYDQMQHSSTYLNGKWGFDWQFKAPSNFVATADGAGTDLFSGPFGNLTAPKEGGTLQGYFSQIPVNSKILANEQTGNPTLVMDCNTLDLWVADIDAYTIADNLVGAGGTSQGPAMNTIQDRFWANTIVFMDRLQPLPIISNNTNLLTLNASYNFYQWYHNDQPLAGASGPDLVAGQSGTYQAEVTVNGGCVVKSNKITINLSDTSATPTPSSVPSEICEVFVPSAFSPDNNGTNEKLCVYGKCLSEMHLKVYDRWGEIVFESRNQNDCWDGDYRNISPGNAVFAWTLEGVLQSGEKIVRKGNVTIVK